MVAKSWAILAFLAACNNGGNSLVSVCQRLSELLSIPLLLPPLAAGLAVGGEFPYPFGLGQVRRRNYLSARV